MINVCRSLVAFFLLLCSLTIVCAQEMNKSETKSDPVPSITMAGTSERVRFTAPGSVVRMHIEVYSAAVETLFDGSSKGNVFDWTLADSAGQRVADGSYLCVVTAKTLSGKIVQRIGTVLVQGNQVNLRGTQAAQMSPAQQQAVGPVEENAALTVLAEGEAPSATVIAHDGQNGQVTSTAGALTFRTGDVFSGKETEQMRLTEEGNVGIGTEQPEARLDVNGMIRARGGFQFSDGSILNLSPKGGLTVTLPSGRTATVNPAPNAVAGTANRIPKFATDGSSLVDSAIYQDPTTGFIGIGTTTPAHPFVVRRNGGSLGVHTVGELFVDRDDRTRSASLTVGTAGTLKWIFGMPSGQDGFQVYDLTNNVSRFFVDPTNGNIGIGTNSPTARLTVSGEALITPSPGGPSITVGTPNGERGLTINGNSFNTRADIRFDGQTLKFVVGPNTGPPTSTNGIAVDTAGNVGIGTLTPTIGRLQAIGGAGQPAIYGESGNRGVWGKSTGSSRGVFGESVSGEGVHGESVSGTGVVGVTQAGGVTFPAVFGSATGNGGVGVLGEGNNGIGVGVLGRSSSATGYALYARNTGGGYGIYSENHVTQQRDMSGFVKAMIYVDDAGNVTRCYNSSLPNGGASTARCGFDVLHSGGGNYTVDFHFQINDRFLALSARSSRGTNNLIPINIGANFTFENIGVDTNSKVFITTFIAPHPEQEYADARFMLIIY